MWMHLCERERAQVWQIHQNAAAHERGRSSVPSQASASGQGYSPGHAPSDGGANVQLSRTHPGLVSHSEMVRAAPDREEQQAVVSRASIQIMTV